MTKPQAPPAGPWLSITTGEGELIQRIDLGQYDLSRPLAGQALLDDIRAAVEKAKAKS